ncbi:DUF2157 domain-containing protein [Demequina mangrovi]|uniref:Predicted membrane protein n=1 Tax=Demequina mangrovi TaxID=1043493 RepID=A0A1H7B7I1_9MICO|nr:DUF2157 domain-containing protein [Demequina mangrovi]SEJ69355.1 Predicted membrane protein [Demequina mangrovi]
MHGLDQRLDRWVEAGIITPETAADLRRFEAAHPEPAAAETPTSSRSLALIGEVIGYLGAVLAVSAVAFLLGRAWEDLPTAGRIALAAALTALVATAGAMAARTAAAPAQRLASVLLVAAVALSGWLAWVVADDAAGVDDEHIGRWVTGVVALAATAVYLARRRGLTQIALLVSLAWALQTFTEPWEAERTALALGLPWTVLGLGWVALALTPLLPPRTPALVTGGLMACLGLQIAAEGDVRGWMLAALVALGAWAVVVAAVRRPLVPLIVPGAVGVLAGVPQLIDHLVGDAVLTWLGVLVAGLALVGVAIWMVRERRRPPGGPGPAADAEDETVVTP